MTVQLSENLIFNGETMQMQVSTSPELPASHPRIVPTGSDFRFSACWRGYVGTWEVKAEQLLLVALRGQYAIDGDQPIVADWFTGRLIAPYGDIIHHAVTIGEHLYANELQIQINNGSVVRTEIIDNHDKLAQIIKQESQVMHYEIPFFLRRAAD